MATEKIEIAKLEFDTTELIKSAGEAEAAFIKLKVAEVELKESTEDTTDELIKNQAAQKSVKKDINEHSKAIGELVNSEGKLVDVTKKSNTAIQKEIKSIEGARKNNKELNSIRNKLNLSTKKGRDSLVLLNQKLDQNNKFIKENVDQYTKQKIGIGQYEEGITSALGKVSIFGVNLGSVTKALIIKRQALNASSKGFKVLKLAIAGTGIGLLLIALASLAAAFKSSEAGQSEFKKILGTIGVIVGNVTDIFANMGEVIIDAFKNPKQAFEDFKTSLKNGFDFINDQIVTRFSARWTLLSSTVEVGILKMRKAWNDFVGDSEKSKELEEAIKDISIEVVNAQKEIERVNEGIVDIFNKAKNAVIEFGKQNAKEVEQQRRLQDLKLATDRIERDLLVEKGRIDAQTALLRLKARQDDKFSAEERLKFLNDALFIQDEIAKKEIQAAANRVKIQSIENSFSKSTKENLDELANREAALFAIQQKRADFQRGIERETFRVRNEIKRSDEKLIKDAEKKESDEIERLKNFNARKTALQNEIDIANEEDAKEKEILKVEQDLIKKELELENLQLDADEKLVLEKLLKETSENELAKIDIKFKKEQDKRNEDLEKKNIALKNKTFDVAVKLFGAETKLGKAVLAIKQIFALQESIIELKSLTFKSKTTLAKANLASAEGVANTAKIGFPQNIPFLIGFAAQLAGVFSAIKSATSLGSSAKFESGGLQEIGGNRHSSGGTKFWGEDGTEFEAEQGELIGVMSRTASESFMKFNNLHSKGNYNSNFLQTGGTVGRNTGTNSPVDVTDIIIEAIANMPTPVVDVKDIINEVNNRINLVDGANV